MGDYTHPEMLVTTEWVSQHGNDAGVRLLEVDVDTAAYNEGHIKGAIGVNWQSQLCDQVRRDILTKEQFEQLCSKCGIKNDTITIFYGDNNNWFATHALWQFRYYGHDENKLKIMNGGRQKWMAEKRLLVREASHCPPTQYKANFPDGNVRSTKETIMASLGKGVLNLVDVRSPAEFTGEVIAPPGMSETAQRGGHIPGAVSIPWSMAMKEDNTFKSYDDLQALYRGKGVDPNKETITYCRIGERSSHTWFVLKYLLGYEKVRNYDGSWTEWGKLIGAPIAKP
jgi:thiosulfate/3-mercaptopyruvate sulfurtransferase